MWFALAAARLPAKLLRRLSNGESAVTESSWTACSERCCQVWCTHGRVPPADSQNSPEAMSVRAQHESVEPLCESHTAQMMDKAS